MHRLRTEALIEAPPARVWAILTEFARYAEWNPQAVSASGEARLGAPVAMEFVDVLKPGKPIRATVRIAALEPLRTLAWIGQLSFLFKGRHYFELHDQGDRTRLVHGEDVSGLIPLLTSRERMRRNMLPGYEAVNRALAERVGSA